MLSKSSIHNDPALAVVGSRLFTGLLDVTSDLGALDHEGLWAVILPYDQPPICARFEAARPATTWRGQRWLGPDLDEWKTSLDHDKFKAGVEYIKNEIIGGNVYQVNLCRVLSAPISQDAEISALAAALAQGNPAPYSAVVRIPSLNLHVASASPERYLFRSGRYVESKPIKGTASTPDGFLAKDYAENVMIVDLVRNDLGRVCEFGSIAAPAINVPERHPGLFHLVSTVSGRLREGVGWAELIEATFPPGSVTGAPKLAAMRVIDQLEPCPRQPYCGAIGWVDADRRRGDLNVAIRTFWFDDGLVKFGTGGGITVDSDAEGEWQETELKARNLLSVASRRAQKSN